MMKKNFKSKGQNLLKKPKSMSELMADDQPEERKDTKTQINKSAKAQEKEELERLHCQIRSDLRKKIDTAIYESRMDSQTKNLTMRTIIEQALEEYFKKGE